jgi:hypothetical protein
LASRRACTSFHGKKGLKAHRCCSWQKIKATNYPLDARPKVLRAMKCFSIKNQGPFKKGKHITNKRLACWGNAFVMPFTFLAYGTQCVPNSKWNCGSLYFPLHVALNVQTIKNGRKIKGLEKYFIANEGCNTPSTKAHIDETI